MSNSTESVDDGAQQSIVESTHIHAVHFERLPDSVIPPFEEGEPGSLLDFVQGANEIIQWRAAARSLVQPKAHDSNIALPVPGILERVGGHVVIAVGNRHFFPVRAQNLVRIITEDRTCLFLPEANKMWAGLTNGKVMSG